MSHPKSYRLSAALKNDAEKGRTLAEDSLKCVHSISFLTIFTRLSFSLDIAYAKHTFSVSSTSRPCIHC